MGFGTALSSFSTGYDKQQDINYAEQERKRKLTALDTQQKENEHQIDRKHQQEQYQDAKREKTLALLKHKTSQVARKEVDTAILGVANGNYRDMKQVLTNRTDSNYNNMMRAEIEKEVGGRIIDVLPPEAGHEAGHTEEDITNDMFTVKYITDTGETATRIMHATNMGASLGTHERVGKSTFLEAMAGTGKKVNPASMETVAEISVDWNGNVKDLQQNLFLAGTMGDNKEALEMLDLMSEVGAKDTASLKEALTVAYTKAGDDPEKRKEIMGKLDRIAEIAKKFEKPSKDTAMINAQKKMAECLEVGDKDCYDKQKALLEDLAQSKTTKAKDLAYMDCMKKGGSAGDCSQQTQYKVKPVEKLQTMIAAERDPAKKADLSLTKMMMDGKMGTKDFLAATVTNRHANGDSEGMRRAYTQFEALYGAGTPQAMSYKKVMYEQAFGSAESQAQAQKDFKAIMDGKEKPMSMSELEAKAIKDGDYNTLKDIEAHKRHMQKPTAPKQQTIATLKAQTVTMPNGPDRDALVAKIAEIEKSSSHMSAGEKLIQKQQDAEVALGEADMTTNQIANIDHYLNDSKDLATRASKGSSLYQSMVADGRGLNLYDGATMTGAMTEGTQNFLRNMKTLQDSAGIKGSSSDVKKHNDAIRGNMRSIAVANYVTKAMDDLAKITSLDYKVTGVGLKSLVFKAFGDGGKLMKSNENMMQRAGVLVQRKKAGKLTGKEKRELSSLENKIGIKTFKNIDAEVFFSVKTMLQGISGMGVTDKEFQAFLAQYAGEDWTSKDAMVTQLQAMAKSQLKTANTEFTSLISAGAYGDAYENQMGVRRAGAYLTNGGYLTKEDHSFGLPTAQAPTVKQAPDTAVGSPFMKSYDKYIASNPNDFPARTQGIKYLNDFHNAPDKGAYVNDLKKRMSHKQIVQLRNLINLTKRVNGGG